MELKVGDKIKSLGTGKFWDGSGFVSTPYNRGRVKEIKQIDFEKGVLQLDGDYTSWFSIEDWEIYKEECKLCIQEREGTLSVSKGENLKLCERHKYLSKVEEEKPLFIDRLQNWFSGLEYPTLWSAEMKDILDDLKEKFKLEYPKPKVKDDWNLAEEQFHESSGKLLCYSEDIKTFIQKVTDDMFKCSRKKNDESPNLREFKEIIQKRAGDLK